MYNMWTQLGMEEEYKNGERVRLMGTDRQGVIVDTTPAFVEVRQDGGTQTYLWGKNKVTKIWSIDKIAVDACICESLDLFHYGCRCGYFKKEG